MHEIKKSDINFRKTVIKSVNNNPEFHFYVDELTENDLMPTYAGLADEKYNFDEMNDEFFRFLERKIQDNGVYLRICYITGKICDGVAVFTIEIGPDEKTFTTDDLDSVKFIDFADYGIKIMGNDIFFGTTVEDFRNTPYFAEFGGDEIYLSLENPLNKFLISIMKEFLEIK